MTGNEFIKRYKELFNKLPNLIVFPKVNREKGGSDILPIDVETVQDLPKRFFNADIDISSFIKTDDGWSVNYTAEEGTYTRLKCSEGRLWVTDNWKGQFDRMHFSSCRKKFSAGDYMYAEFPQAWDNYAKKTLEEKYNLKYFLYGKNTPSRCFFPDGFQKSILIPIPLNRLETILKCQEAMSKDQDIATSFIGTAKLITSTVNYIIGRNPEKITSPNSLPLHIFETTGLISSPPEIQTADDGTSALTTHRSHYLYQVKVFFRDLFKVTQYLEHYGLLGKNTEENSYTAPDAIEFAAMVMPDELVDFEKNISFFDKHDTRRVFYSYLSEENDLYHLLDQPSNSQVQSTINTTVKTVNELVELVVNYVIDIGESHKQ